MRPTLAVVLLLNAATAQAYRPFDGTDADVADLGELELELGPLGWSRSGAEDVLVFPAVVFNFGITEGWEFVVTGRNELPLKGHDRLTDTGVFLKGIMREGVLQGRTGLSVAAELGVLLPTWYDEPGAGASAAVIASYQWALLTLHFNTELRYTRSHRLAVSAGIIAEGPRAWRVRPVAELLVDGEVTGPFEGSALIGALWPLGEHVVFDAAVRVGNAGLEVRAGLTWAVSFIGEPAQPQQER
jgi:hypothetical protein